MAETKPEVAKVGRLAMRRERELWCAYYAMPDTMDNAIFLGSIRMGAIVDNPERKQAFMNMMRDALAEIFAAKGHDVAAWDMHKAPEHERTGSRLVDAGEIFKGKS